jgi:6-pyruvoyltetrahydropterin/6-carboxytetrahydropterin synthase
VAKPIFIEVRHNIEVAHRLYLTPGKCENIHGHSMWIDLKLYGHHLNSGGMLCGLDGRPLEFGIVKRAFRAHLDSTYDHHLLLNVNDPWASPVDLDLNRTEQLPGLVTVFGDPSTENIAKWIAEWAAKFFKTDVDVLVRETSVNAAAYGVNYGE